MDRTTAQIANFLFAAPVFHERGQVGALICTQTTEGINQFLDILNVLKLHDNLSQIITKILNSPDVAEPLKTKIKAELRWQQQLTPAKPEQISREIDNALKTIINERDKTALSENDPAYTLIDQAINHARTLICTCGNPEMGFNCSCNWTRKHPGTTKFSCGHCGIYDAAKPQCNLCQEEADSPADEDENDDRLIYKDEDGIWQPANNSDQAMYAAQDANAQEED